MVTYGVKDAWVSGAAVQQLAQKLSADAKVVDFRDSGHLPHLDERERYLKALLPFMQHAEGSA